MIGVNVEKGKGADESSRGSKLSEWIHMLGCVMLVGMGLGLYSFGNVENAEKPEIQHIITDKNQVESMKEANITDTNVQKYIKQGDTK